MDTTAFEKSRKFFIKASIFYILVGAVVYCLFCFIVLRYSGKIELKEVSWRIEQGIHQVFRSDKTVDAKNLYMVTKVVDGDTIYVEDSSEEKFTVRLLGIDTPELKDPRKPVQCFAQEASLRTKDLLEGKEVYLESDSTQEDVDKYGRSLRYVYRKEDNNFINLELIQEGYAFEYTYDKPYLYQEEFKEAERLARENKEGLWAENTCNGEK
jgi:micrococcal nuclease